MKASNIELENKLKECLLFNAVDFKHIPKFK